MLLVLGFLYLVRGVLLPFVVAFIVAALLEPAVRKLRLRGYSRGLSVTLIFVAFFGVIIAAGLWLTSPITRQVSNLNQNVQSFTDSIAKTNANANFFVRWNPVLQAQQSTTADQIDVTLGQFAPSLRRLGLPATKHEIMTQYVEKQRPQIVKLIQSFFDGFLGVLGSVASQLLSLMLVPLLVFFLLLDMENFKRKSPKWIPPSIRGPALGLLGDIYGVFVTYLRGVTMIVGLYMICGALLLTLLGVPYGIVLGILFGALYLIPFVGNWISMLTLFLVVGLSNTTGNFGMGVASPWLYAIICILVFFAMGTVFDQILYPKIVGGSIGLTPIASFFVIACGYSLFGVAGMILAYPVAGSIKIILDRLLKVTSNIPDVLEIPAVPLRHRTA